MKRNSAVEVFRHALALDESRRMFRPTHWDANQRFKPNPYLPDDHPLVRDQDAEALWFAGVHGDVGGGYPEAESGTAKFPLAWMVEEARAHGLEFWERMVERLVYGRNPRNARRTYIAPNTTAKLHQSLRSGWSLLELPPGWNAPPGSDATASFGRTRRQPSPRPPPSFMPPPQTCSSGALRGQYEFPYGL